MARVNVLIYCGHAKATVKVGATTLSLQNGLCERRPWGHYLSFGAVVTQQTKYVPDSFQLVAGSSAKPATHDGSYSGTTVMLSRKGKNYLADAVTLTLTHNTKAGAATGKIEPTLRRREGRARTCPSPAEPDQTPAAVTTKSVAKPSMIPASMSHVISTGLPYLRLTAKSSCTT